MANWSSRILLGSLTLLLSGIVAVIVVMGLQIKREYAVVQQRHAELSDELTHLREERLEKEAYLRRFLKDREFVERVVRERLGYVEPGEVLFRFED